MRCKMNKFTLLEPMVKFIDTAIFQVFKKHCHPEGFFKTQTIKNCVRNASVASGKPLVILILTQKHACNPLMRGIMD